MSNPNNLIFNSDNNHYYQVTDTAHQSWADAVTEANELGGYLVSIDDATELNLIQQSLNSTEQYWVGGADNNVFTAATGDTYIANPSDDLAMSAVIEYDSIPTYLSTTTAIPTFDITGISFATDLTGISNAGLIGIVSADEDEDSSLIDLDEITSLLPNELQYLWDTVSIEETADNEVTLSWQDEINLTELFDVSSFLPNLAIDTPTFVITDEASSTTYEFAGDITVGTEEFGLGASFTKEGENQFDWDMISIADFSLDSLTTWLGDTVAGVDSFLGDDLPTIDLTITEAELEFSWQDELNFTELFNLDGFLPDVTIADPTFAIASEASTTSYEFAGDLAIGGAEFGLATSFTKEAGQLNWDEISISDFSLGSLATWIGGAIEEVEDIFGDGLPTIDLTITEEQVDFSGSLDFANSNNEYLGWINDNLGLDTLDVVFSYNTDGEIALAAGIAGEFTIIDTNDVEITLTEVFLGFEVSGSAGSREVSLGLDAAAVLNSGDTSLDLTGGIEFAFGTGGFEAEAYFALDASDDSGWVNPFDLPDATIYSFGLQVGIGVAGFDSFGFRGNLEFGSYYFDAAFSVDLTNPNEFALAATINQPIPVLDLITGPAASYALDRVADDVAFIEDAQDIMNQVLNIEVVSTDSDGDGELDPLIYIVPEETEIAGKTYEQGFSINAAVSAWGQDASVYFNANAETGEISGGLEIEKIEIGIDDFEDILVIEGSDNQEDADDDNLNLDFKISEDENYLRGDGKITFLGQSIDAYMEAGTLTDDNGNEIGQGLKIAVATENSVLSTDLDVVISDSGFAASGEIDLDLNLDVDLGAIGTYTLVDFGVNVEASISVDETSVDGTVFSSSFKGSLSLYGHEVNFNFSVGVPFPSLDSLYQELVDGIVDKIESIGSGIFDTVEEWANAIADGVVSFAGDVADVAANVYDATEEAFIAAAETIGETAEDIANGLSNAYGAAEDAVVGFLEDAGYATEEIASALANGIGATANEIADAFESAGSTATEIANALANGIGATVNEVTQALNFIGTSSSAIANTLIGEFSATATDISNAFNSIGSTASDVAKILDNSFNLTANQMTSALESAFNVGTNSMADILKDAGYEINSIIGSLKSFYNATTTPVTEALKSAGYTINQIAGSAVTSSAYWFTKGLSNVGYTANQIAGAFKGVGKSIDFISSGLKDVFSYDATEVAGILKSVNYGFEEIGNALDHVYSLSANDMAKALRSINNDIDDVGKFLKQELGFGKSSVKSALRSAGFNKVNKWANKFWNSFKFW